MKNILAFDVGGTKILYALIDENGEFKSEIKRVSTPRSITELENLFKQIIKQFEDKADIVSFATAGAVNRENTKVDSSTFNMPIGYNKLDFSKLSKKKVYVENDANAAAWAEYKKGAAQEEDNTITITLGTGVGGGFIVDGRLLRGKSGKAGEVGSIKIKDKGRICTCNNNDCFEAYASGTGLKLTAQEIASVDMSFKTSIYKNKLPEDITTYDIIDGIKMHDKYSIKVFEIWENDIITGLINIANIFDPQSIIISGGMGEFLNVEKVEKSLNEKIVVSPVKIKQAKMGNLSGLIGSALLVFEKFCL